MQDFVRRLCSTLCGFVRAFCGSVRVSCENYGKTIFRLLKSFCGEYLHLGELEGRGLLGPPPPSKMLKSLYQVGPRRHWSELRYFLKVKKHIFGLLTPLGGLLDPNFVHLEMEANMRCDFEATQSPSWTL